MNLKYDCKLHFKIKVRAALETEASGKGTHLILTPLMIVISDKLTAT
jgi:hypothetical protein